MITVLSPAKKLSKENCAHTGTFTQPEFLRESETLVQGLRELDSLSLQSLMGISDNLSFMNWERYQAWTLPFEPGSARQAFYTFTGDTYAGLDANTLSDDEVLFAQDNTRILSGLYGVLKPLDLMMPYRLEMSTKLENKIGKNLYDYWSTKLSEFISKELENHEDNIVINCASVEYFKSLDNSELKAKVITPLFKEIRDGEPKMISFFAKKARGMMARFIIQNRIQSVKNILAFDLDGYKYDHALSSPFQPVFTRAQA